MRLTLSLSLSLSLSLALPLSLWRDVFGPQFTGGRDFVLTISESDEILPGLKDLVFSEKLGLNEPPTQPALCRHVWAHNPTLPSD
jgi:hypothetical protein